MKPTIRQDQDVCFLSADELRALYLAKDVSPLDVMKQQIERIERYNPAVNALADTYFDEALAQAALAESAFAKDGENARPLEGIPVLVKDAQRLAGKRTTHGSLIYRDNIDRHSDPMIERLLEAGAVVHGRSTTPEFCLSGACTSRLWGVTRNPFNPAYGPGGSSGGSAAALAAGFTTLATGTDIGGSVRIPAACCGVVGFKPPHGRNPDGPPNNFDRYNHCGPMTRSVGDIALMQNIVSGPHPADHDSLRENIDIPIKIMDLRGRKVAWSMDFGYLEVDWDVQMNTLSALEVFSDLGAELVNVPLDWSPDCDEAAMHWYNSMHYHRQTVWHRERHADLLTDYALATAQGVESTGPDDMARSWEVQHRMYQSFGKVMADADLFICPTNTLPALKADHDTAADPLTINGVQVGSEYGWIMTHHFNMLHNCPVISVPSGVAANGVPTGIQIVGKTFDDISVVTAALAYEAAVGGWFRREESRPGL